MANAEQLRPAKVLHDYSQAFGEMPFDGSHDGKAAKTERLMAPVLDAMQLR